MNRQKNEMQSVFTGVGIGGVRGERVIQGAIQYYYCGASFEAPVLSRSNLTEHFGG